ncbi:helix-turn-helix transcriptional regulator [Photobacterium sp. WH24]|uniref:helix-turn-helix domain-containing protein n=1 Tax=Photobacterium TaxID=657 RepID=UPI001C43765D|nr:MULTISPECIES: helix-turn-helix transcriptional regulator [Photobacterium]MBV7262591.1 helix-turn-helix transcriptional regulator [Photobacterium sp. WH24]
MSSEDWIEALKQEIAKPGRSQNQVALELGVSSSKLSQVLRGIYPGQVEDLKIAVEGKYMAKTVVCPIKGEIAVDVCKAFQKQPFSSANRERVRLYRACRSGCPHSSLTNKQQGQRIEVQQVEVQYYALDEQRAFINRASGGDLEKKLALYDKELERLAVKYNQLLWAKNNSKQ